MSIQTAERSTHIDPSENTNFQRHLIAYKEATKYVTGHLLELGSGEGYGIQELRPFVKQYLALDKYKPNFDFEKFDVTFENCTFPNLDKIADNTYDCVVSFQVVEHIEDDFTFISEIYRVLKPGGKLILTTPNRLMSITRNPWHIREYDAKSMAALISSKFKSFEMLGIDGNDRVKDYYRKNKISVEKITRFDVFNLQYNLPRWMLKIPYDLLNRYNKNKLLTNSGPLSDTINFSDFLIRSFDDTCMDFFIIATK